MKGKSDNKIENVVIIIAMRDEAHPVIDTLALTEITNILHPKLPMRCYGGKLNSINVYLIVSGVDARYDVENIGSEAATLMAFESVTKLDPDLLISAGTAGGFKSQGARIGTVYISSEYFIFHDRHVPLAGFEQSAIGRYPAAKVDRLSMHLGLKQGIISTGSSLKKNNDDLKIMTAHNAVAKEMESAAIAWIANLYKVPVIALKSITNLLDEENASESEFVKNLSYASSCLQKKLISLLEFINGKTISELG